MWCLGGVLSRRGRVEVNSFSLLKDAMQTIAQMRPHISPTHPPTLTASWSWVRAAWPSLLVSMMKLASRVSM